MVRANNRKIREEREEGKEERLETQYSIDNPFIPSLNPSALLPPPAAAAPGGGGGARLLPTFGLPGTLFSAEAYSRLGVASPDEAVEPVVDEGCVAEEGVRGREPCSDAEGGGGGRRRVLGAEGKSAVEEEEVEGEGEGG
jgi:hypothetical protein